MRRRLIASLLSVIVAVGAPTVAFAQDAAPKDKDSGNTSNPGDTATDAQKAQFKQLTAKASKAYEQGKYDDAVALFKKAYALRPVSNILYNIGRIYEEAGNIDGAIQYYDKFVVAPNVQQSARKDAVERLKTLRDVKKVKEGDTATAKNSNTAPDNTTQTTATVATTQPPPKKSPSTARAVGWVFLGVGGASLIGSGIFALVTQNQYDKFTNAQNLDDRRAAASAGRTDGIVSDSLLIAGVVTAVTGGIFLLASSGHETDTETAAKASTSRWAVSPWIGKRTVGLGLAAAF